jgi:hypothetical protein
MGTDHFSHPTGPSIRGMPKFACRCGEILNLSEGWSEAELLLVPERVVEQVADNIDAGTLRSAEDFYSEINREGTAVYRCPRCARLHVETSRGMFVPYAKE